MRLTHSNPNAYLRPMPLYFHGNAPLKFQHQYLVTLNYIIPYIEKQQAFREGMHVLEIGCGEGGVLKAFAERNCFCTGMDLSTSKIDHGKELLADEIAAGKMELFSADIYDQKTMDAFKGKFDLIVLKDTIEHIPEQEKVMEQLKIYLKTNGRLFFAFPPWRMPFGGHQQTATTKIGKLPWMHLLPRSLYQAWLRKIGEPEPTVVSLMEIYDTQISINRFERICKRSGYTIQNRRLYLINPIYRYKFGRSPRIQFSFLSVIPWFRDFVSTTAYYILKLN
jgi:SAM-dependent methyltransferase